MLELRKRKEAEVFKEKQASRQKMIDQQAKNLAQMASNEETRLEKQVLEKEIHEEKKRLEKEESMRKWQDEIDRSRQQQIHRKRVEREHQRSEESETAAFLSEWCQTLDKQEQDEQDLKRMAAKKLANEHKKQVEIQRRRKEEGKAQEDQVATRAKRAMEADTIEFHNYAEHCIRDYAEEGKNVIPLIKELREFRKRVQ